MPFWEILLSISVQLNTPQRLIIQNNHFVLHLFKTNKLKTAIHFFFAIVLSMNLTGQVLPKIYWIDNSTFLQLTGGQIMAQNLRTGEDKVLLNELIRYNKQFQFMAYPNRTHNINEGEGTEMHLKTLYTEYLRAHCTPGGR